MILLYGIYLPASCGIAEALAIDCRLIGGRDRSGISELLNCGRLSSGWDWLDRSYRLRRTDVGIVLCIDCGRCE